MTTFYVGQRVRIIGADIGDPESMAQIGKETVVNELDCRNEYDQDGCIGVTIDGDTEWCFWPYQLEPLSDSNTLVSWESMRDLWVPERLREAA